MFFAFSRSSNSSSRVRSLQFGQLRVHFLIGRLQVQLGGALLHDLVVDQLVQDV